MTASALRELVLVGGGHTHIQVLRHCAMVPFAGVRLTLVVDRPLAVYSGMVPGFVAGQYRAEELEIDVVPLARRAGARLVLGVADGIDVEARRLQIADRASLAYDLISFDIGSVVAGLDLPGVRDHALPTRPIGLFTGRVDQWLRRRGAGESIDLVIVGGGVGGVELAFTLQSRLIGQGVTSRITLLESGEELLPGLPASLRRQVEAAADRRGIARRCGTRVARVEADAVLLDDESSLPSDLTCWVTGASSQPIFRQAGLPVDERGFVHIDGTLQVPGHEEIFAVGDCATLVDHPETPKAGVYAVRQGPYLIDNLRAFLEDEPRRRYRPQRDFLALLNLGDGTAIGSKWGMAFSGGWVWRLKDWIDRRFMRLFEVLDAAGRPLAAPMEMQGERSCGGCAAKLPQGALSRSLGRLETASADDVLVGLREAADAAVVRMPGGDLLASSIDLFSAFVDDPWVVGAAAAANALSDLWAIGAEPRHVLAVVALPEDESGETAEETLYQALSGARSVLDPLGVTLVGGHTTTADRLMVGFQAAGLLSPGAAERLASRPRPGDHLLLTRPLGTGVIFRADMSGSARGPWVAAALEHVTTSHAASWESIRSHAVHAGTDVTGFGLAGHLSAMLASSGLGARVGLEELPALAGAIELLRLGVRSTAHAANRALAERMSIDPSCGDDPRLELLFDPQTCGGLLLAMAAEEAAVLHRELVARGEAAAVIGRVEEVAAEATLVVVPSLGSG